MNVREPAAHLGFAGVRMAGPEPGQAESAHRRTHVVSELELPPCRRPPQQLDLHPFDFGTGIGGLRLHHGIIVTFGRPPVEQCELG